jgi:class 3 adenylate cyclase
VTSENVTVLFTDLVDSTALQSGLDPAAADQLRNSHFTVLRQAIGKSGGTEVKNLGDGLMVVFNSASAALSCAVEMQQGVNLFSADHDRVLTIRIGLSGGEATREGDDYFGDPVIEASRLCATCQGGQILAADLVRLTAGRRSSHSSRPLGPMTLKGLPEPIDVIEILWEPLRRANRDHSSLPELLVDRRRPIFAGRQKESEILHGAYATVRTGATRLVLLAGEPGIGKTRIASELAQHVIDDGGVVLAGRCDELVGVPYQPFVEALRWLVAQPDSTKGLGKRAGEIVRLVPELANIVLDLPPPLQSTPEAERLALFDAVREWIAETTQERPMLLVLDDLHWADMGTLLLLRHLIANDPVPGLLAVATYRDTDLDRTHPLSSVLAELHRRGDVVRLSLVGLEVGEVSDFMTLQAGHELGDEAIRLAAALSEETGGNPFFVGEVLRHLAESGAIVQREGRWTTTSDGDTYLPEGIRQVVGQRLSALPEMTQGLLSSASVIGARFDIDVLAEVSGQSIDDVLDGLEPAIAAHLVLDSGSGHFQFAHALVRSTLHGEITSTRRARLHLAVARALESAHAKNLDSVMAELAYHWGEVGIMNAGDSAQGYAQRAAELAMERVAPDEAARWYRIARERLEPSETVLDAELLYRLGVAEMWAGESTWQVTLLEAARRAESLGDLALMTSALILNRRLAFGVDTAENFSQQKIELLERACELASGDPLRGATLITALAVEVLFTGDFRRRDQLFEESDSLAAQIGDVGESAYLEAKSFAARGQSYTQLNPRARIQRMNEALELSSIRSDVERTAWVQGNRWYASMGFDPSLRHGYLREIQNMKWLDPLLDDAWLLLAMESAFLDGKIEEGAEIAVEIQHRMVTHANDDLAWPASAGPLQAMQESLDLDSMIVDVLAQIDEVNGVDPLVNSEAALRAWLLSVAGRLDECSELVGRWGHDGFRDIPDDAGYSMAWTRWALSATAVENRGACRSLIEIGDWWLGDDYVYTGGWHHGPVAYYRAQLASVLDDTETDRHFLKSIVDSETMNSPLWLARSNLAYAEYLLARHDRARAREYANKSLHAVGSLALHQTSRRARSVLVAAT